ncbi:MAG: efflux transporter periplasmic adaptor subunit, partial [Proteobacteria bacterium]|nr:efflux transporter periplasmic adaptor subunit [Pseudomonadota bacterium]
PLGHGFRVDVRIVLWRADNLLRVPTDALVRNGADWAVFRIINGRARLTPVAIGNGDSNYRALRSGLRAGDQVVLFPGDSLADNAHVRAGARPPPTRQR